MRKNIVAGNWKMNQNFEQSQVLINQINQFVENHDCNCEVVIAPTFLFVNMAQDLCTNKKTKVAVQDMSEHVSGAFTGEISADMIASCKIPYVILGHSERRLYHGETDSHINRKVKLALENSLKPIYCNGENLEQRKAGEHFEVVKNQTQTALFTLSADEIKQVIIAYEPVWAIGTGETATAEQAQEIHAYIRQLIAEKYGQEVANEISILYGGSVKPDNAKDIFSKPDVDGGLIGGAALKVEDFSAIIKAFDE